MATPPGGEAAMNKPLPAGWCRVRLGEVLEQVNRFEVVRPDCEYRLLGVK
jgi:hypothetical protein